MNIESLKQSLETDINNNKEILKDIKKNIDDGKKWATILKKQYDLLSKLNKEFETVIETGLITDEQTENIQQIKAEIEELSK